MKRAMNLIMIFAFVLNCTYGVKQHGYFDYKREQRLVISDHVGETIEPEERKKYNLFPMIDNFKYAVFYEIEGGGYEVKIVTSEKIFTSVNRDPNAINILRDYIKGYEEIQKSRATFEKNWGIAGYDELGQPITQDEINRIKGFDNTVRCGGSCCSLGLISLLVMSELAGMVKAAGGGINYKPFYYVIGATVAVTTAAVLEGYRQDKSNALKVIKEARKPREVR